MAFAGIGNTINLQQKMTNGGKRSIVPGLDCMDYLVVFGVYGVDNMKLRSGRTARECSAAKRFAGRTRRGASRLRVKQG